MLNPWKKPMDSGPQNAQKFEWSGRYSKYDKQFSEFEKSNAGVYKLKAGEFLMTIDDFKDAFKHYTVTYLHDDWNNSFIEKRQAVNRKNYRFNFTISAEDVGLFAEPTPVARPEPAAPAKDEPEPAHNEH